MYTNYTQEEIDDLKFAIAYKKAIDDREEELHPTQKSSTPLPEYSPTQKPLDLGLLSRQGFVTHYNKGASLIKKGGYSQTMFIVINGEVVIDFGSGRTKLIKGGEMFGELGLLAGEPIDVSAVATMNTAVISLSDDTIEEAIRLVPALGVKIMQYLASKVATKSY